MLINITSTLSDYGNAYHWTNGVIIDSLRQVIYFIHLHNTQAFVIRSINLVMNEWMAMLLLQLYFIPIFWAEEYTTLNIIFSENGLLQNNV